MKEHSNRYRAQFSRIRQIKELVADPINKSKLLRIDWSENAELYQTRQEKSVYYTQISSSINTGVLYSPDGVLSQMLKSIDMTNTDILYIVSDSPTSQYRNKNNIFLAKNGPLKIIFKYIGYLQKVDMGKAQWMVSGLRLNTQLKILSHIIPMKSFAIRSNY